MIDKAGLTVDDIMKWMSGAGIVVFFENEVIVGDIDIVEIGVREVNVLIAIVSEVEDFRFTEVVVNNVAVVSFTSKVIVHGVININIVEIGVEKVNDIVSEFTAAEDI